MTWKYITLADELGDAIEATHVDKIRPQLKAA